MDFPKLRPVRVIKTEYNGSPLYALTDPLGIAVNPIGVSPGTFELLKKFDGKNSIRDIQTEATRLEGNIVFSADIENLINTLDREYFLESDRFRSRLSEIEKDYRRDGTRRAQFAGESYPGDPEELGRLLDKLSGPDADDRESDNPFHDRKPNGAIIPHIDLTRGGGTYGSAYSEIKSIPQPETFIILGTCHQPSEELFILTGNDFSTPFGNLDTDKELLEALNSKTGNKYMTGEWLHGKEHSVEFQTLFISKYFPGSRILPVLCGSFADFETGKYPAFPPPQADEFIHALRESIENTGRSVFVIASADLSHVGPQFGDSYRVEGLHPKRVELEDRTFLEGFITGDRHELYKVLAGGNNRNHICGYASIYTMMGICEPSEGWLRSYRQWLDPEGTVTFAAALSFPVD